MGKSNNLHNAIEKIYQREKNLNNFFKEDEIQILENIYDYFIKKIITDSSLFVANNIQLVSYSIKTELYNRSNIKNLRCINLIETSSDNNKSFIIFSSSFLSVMIDLLFGGNGNCINEINPEENITSAELFVNKKIITIIIESLSHTFKKFFSQKIKFIHVKILTNLKKIDFNELFLISCFNFKFNDIKIFFSILIPLSKIQQLNRKIVIPTNNKKDIHIEKNILNTIAFSNMYDVKIEIIARIINISISYNEFENLLVGSVLSMQKPDKIIAFIEKKPVFFANYKRFNDQSIIFIEEFINNNLEFNQDKENTLMSHIQKSSDNEQLINSEKKISKYENTTSISQKKIDNKKILLDTVVNITVELGRSKIKIKDFLGFSIGSMLVLDKLIKEPLDIFINNHLIASGEIVFLENKYGLRITSINNTLKKNYKLISLNLKFMKKQYVFSIIIEYVSTDIR